MKRPIPSSIHGVLDYVTAPTLLALPRLLQWGTKATTVLTVAGAGVLGYSVMTRYELGLIKLLPMKWHLALDIVGGATLAAAPFLFLDEEERTPDRLGTFIGLGAYEIVVAMLTQPYSTVEQISQADMLSDTVDEVIEVIV